LKIDVNLDTSFTWQQTSTADMLDLAVEYIKDLRQQVKVLENDKSFHKSLRE